MEEEAQQHRRRRSARLVLWLIGGVVLLLMLGIGFALFGPDPPIIISKQTTYITSPLGADGLPDYAAWLLAKSRKGRTGAGVTPENNGAVPFLKAMWPNEGDSYDELPAEDAKLLCKELGIAYPPPSTHKIGPIVSDKNRLSGLRLLRERLIPPDEGGKESNTEDLYGWQEVRLGYAEFFEMDEQTAMQDGRVANFLDLLQPVDRPWTSQDLPFMAEWLEENDVGFKLLTEASKRPEWYCPPTELVGPGQGLLWSISLWAVQQQREAARLLTTRANYALGEGRQADAAEDTLAIFRLAQHTRVGHTLVEQLVACALEGIGFRLAQNVAADVETPIDALRRLIDQLESTDSRTSLVAGYDTGERLYALDAVLAMSRGGNLNDLDMSDGESIFGVVRIDWNVPLRDLNSHFDEAVTALNLPTWTLRKDALEVLEAKAAANPFPTQSPGRFFSGLLSAKGRGELTSDFVLSLLTAAHSAMMNADDRVTSNRELTRLALALAIYRKQQGDYPESLEALTPSVLPELPADLFHNKPFTYRKTEDGYLLYSLGPNGKDDGGSNEGDNHISFEPVFEGRAIEEPDFDHGGYDPETGDWIDTEGSARAEAEREALIEKIPAGADDISLRMPLPEPEPWPWEVQGPETSEAAP